MWRVGGTKCPPCVGIRFWRSKNAVLVQHSFTKNMRSFTRVGYNVALSMIAIHVGVYRLYLNLYSSSVSISGRRRHRYTRFLYIEIE